MEAIIRWQPITVQEQINILKKVEVLQEKNQNLDHELNRLGVELESLDRKKNSIIAKRDQDK